MKIFVKILLLLFISTALVPAQTISLPAIWKFHTGDDIKYADPGCHDCAWTDIKVNVYWENQGFPDYDGYGWYRVHFSVDRNLLKKPLYLFAGKIDDIDATYLNGQLIGTTGEFPPINNSAWSTQRVYKIPAGLLKSDNVLAIRVFDGGGPGGIYGGIMGIYGKKEYTDLTRGTDSKGRSCFQMPISNGLLAAVYDEKAGEIGNVFPHIFQSLDLNKTVDPVFKGIRLASNLKPQKNCYYKNTHVLEITYPGVKLYHFASFTRPEKILYSVLEYPDKKGLNYYLRLPDLSSTILRDSVLARNNGLVHKYYLVSFRNLEQNNVEALDKAVTELAAKPNLLETEISYMTGLFKKVHTPKHLNAAERNLFEQSVTFLKMAQVGEQEIYPKSRGQIVASLPPGIWNICWVRDGSYSIRALTHLGLFTEAKQALQFILNADAGYYKNFKHSDGKEYGIGVPYQVSVCRYFGIGKEESDSDNNGPNIELDGFGLILSAFSDYVKVSGDTAFLSQYSKLLKYKVADALLANIHSNGLIRPESSAWERHLPGKQFAFTSISAAKGLQDFGALLKEHKKDGADRYLQAGELLQENILKKLGENGLLIRGTFEDKKESDHEYFDAATYEYFNAFKADAKLFAFHHDAYTKKLSLGKNRGLCRVNNGDWYDKQEWIFLDLRIAAALNKFSKPSEAKKMITWVVKQSALNNNIVSELYNEKTGAYEGASPMVGFGSASYILTMLGL